MHRLRLRNAHSQMADGLPLMKGSSHFSRMLLIMWNGEESAGGPCALKTTARRV